MNEKILLYIVAAIGYYLYSRYQKLQQDAVERKKSIESKSIPQPANIKPMVVQKTLKQLKQPMVHAEINNPKQNFRSTEKKEIREIQSDKTVKTLSRESLQRKHDSITENKDFSQEPKTEGVKNLFEIDLEKMVIYSTIFQQPAFLKY